MKYYFGVFLILILSGCIKNRDVPIYVPLSYTPIKKDKYKSPQEADIALKLAKNKCRAFALNKTNEKDLQQIPEPSKSRDTISGNNNLIINSNRRGRSGFIYYDNAGAMRRAYEAGRRMRLNEELANQRRTTMKANMEACMNKEGFMKDLTSHLN